jgi:hypothetical protein
MDSVRSPSGVHQEAVRSPSARIPDSHLENWQSNPVRRSFDFPPQFSMWRAHGELFGELMIEFFFRD